MQEHERETYRLHAKLPVYRRRVERSQAVIREALARCRAPYVAYSAGKDSAVLLHLVTGIAPVEARLLRWPETDLLADFAAVLTAFRARGVTIYELALHRDRLDESVPDKWRQLHAFRPADAVFLGLREAESRPRRIALRRWGALHQHSDGLLHCSPLASWTTADIAAHIVVHDLPVLDTYARHGIDARTTTRIARAKNVIGQQQLHRLREDNPVAYGWLREMYPDVAEHE